MPTDSYDVPALRRDLLTDGIVGLPGAFPPHWADHLREDIDALFAQALTRPDGPERSISPGTATSAPRRRRTGIAGSPRWRSTSRRWTRCPRWVPSRSPPVPTGSPGTTLRQRHTIEGLVMGDA